MPRREHRSGRLFGQAVCCCTRMPSSSFDPLVRIGRAALPRHTRTRRQAEPSCGPHGEAWLSECVVQASGDPLLAAWSPSYPSQPRPASAGGTSHNPRPSRELGPGRMQGKARRPNCELGPAAEFDDMTRVKSPSPTLLQHWQAVRGCYDKQLPWHRLSTLALCCQPGQARILG